MKNILSIFLLSIGLQAIAQSEDKLSKLFDKKWSITAYEFEGQSIPETNAGKNDGTIFYKDHTSKSIDRGTILWSKWKYDATLNTLTLHNDSTKETSSMKILSLSDTELLWEMKNPEGTTMIIRMKSAGEK